MKSRREIEKVLVGHLIIKLTSVLEAGRLECVEDMRDLSPVPWWESE